MRNLKPKFEEKDLGENVFKDSFVIPVNERQFDKQYTLDKDGETLIPVIQDVEATPITKVFVTPERRKIVNFLSPKAKSFFLWLMYELDAGKDYTWINKDRYMKELEITSVNTIKDAIKELHRYALISPTVIKDVYWINPDFFFRGDRIRKYPKNVKKCQKQKE